MIFLSLTTSTEQSGFAVFKNKKVVFKKIWLKKSGSGKSLNSDVLNLEIDKHFKKFKILYSDLSGILLDIGPGSFTGCRISSSVAKTISYTFNIPIYTTTSLELMLFQNRKLNKNNLLAVIDAQKSLFYCRKPNDSELKLISKEELFNLLTPSNLVVGLFDTDLKVQFKSRKIKTSPSANARFPSPLTLGQLFFEKPESFKSKNWIEVEPLYIRAPDAVTNFINKN